MSTKFPESLNPSKYNGNKGTRDESARRVSASAHSRVLTQRRRGSRSEDDLFVVVEAQCSLTSDVIGRIYNDSNQTWTVTSDVFSEINNDIQRVMDCLVEDDVLLFITNGTIQPLRTMNISVPLTLRGESGATLTCPQQGPLLISRSSSFTMENLVISGCNGTSSILVLSPECTEGTLQGTSVFGNVSFEDNAIFETGHIIEANNSCSELEITGVVFLRNRCVGTHCVALGTRNTLTSIYLVSNQGSSKTSLDSSIFYASNRSATFSRNVTSLNNEIRSFYIFNGTLSMSHCLFEGNKRNQSSVTRHNSIGGGVLFSHHSSVSISSTTFERNQALNGGGVFAWASNITIIGCRFRENDASEGSGGALHGHRNSSFDISSSVLWENRGYVGAGLYSNYSVRVNMVNVSVLENNNSRTGNVWLSNGVARIRSSSFIQNIAYRGAGALFTLAVNLSLNNSTFVGNDAIVGGACVFQSNRKVRASNLSFENNTAREMDGGGIYLSFGSHMRITDSLFRNNYAQSDGGAIYAVGESETILRRVVFLNNTSNDDAGAVAIRRGSFTGSHLTFRRNNATSHGGAINSYEADTVSVISSRFEDNEAETGGAVFFFETTSGHLERTTFVKNAARNDAGGAILASASNVNISSSVFLANNSPFGGSLFLTRCNSTVLDSRFENNTAKNRGGAIYVATTSSVLLSRSSFLGNRGSRGGAISVQSYSNISVLGAEFVANSASAYGGCLYLFEFGRGSVSNSLFSNNTAERGGGGIFSRENVELSISNSTLVGNSGGFSGGGVHVSTHSTLELIAVRFDTNEAGGGGAIHLSSSCNATVLNCSFTNNTIEDYGGAIEVQYSSAVSVTNSTFSRNTAGVGGGLSIAYNSTAMLLFSTLTRNHASRLGGAVHLRSSNMFLLSIPFDSNSARDGGSLSAVRASIQMINSTISRSSAFFMGGAVHITSTNATLETVRLESNEARVDGGGIYVSHASSLLCYSCLILDNRASNGAGMYAYSDNSIPVVAQFQNSRFENNSAQSDGGGINFASHWNRSINCSSRSVTCGRIVLLNTSFLDNYANRSGAIVLTTDLIRVVVGCHYRGGRNQGFLNESDISSLEVIHPRRLCSTWKRNRVSSNVYGGLVGTYGREIVLAIDPEDEVRLLGSTRDGYVLENVRSGRQLPTINVTVLDGYGLGPAPTFPYSFEARISSPDNFLSGFIPTNIVDGFGNFSRVIGLVHPGNYTLQFTFDNEAFEAFNVTVIVRACVVGEEPTSDGLACQDCDSVHYNFNPTDPSGCRQCPEGANCTGRYIVPKKGHWHNSPCHDTVQECLLDEACAYKDRDETLTNFTQNSTDCNFNETTIEEYNDALCNEGYKGPICGSCKKIFGLSVRFLCLKCASTFLSLLTILGIAIYLLAASSLTIRGCLPSNLKPKDHQPTSSHSINASESSYRDPEVNIQMVKMLVEGHVPQEYMEHRQLPCTSQVDTRSNQLEIEHELTRWRTTETLKIMLNFLQTTAVAATINVKWTGGMLTLFEASEYVGALTTVAVSRPVDCIVSSSSAVKRAIWRMLVSIFVPGAVVSMLVFVWGCIAFREKKGWPYFCKRVTLTVIAVTYISYLGLTKMTVRAFYCVSIYNSSSASANTKERLWAVDTAIKCYGKDHSGIIAIAVVVNFIVTICFPLISALVLSRNKEKQKQRDSWIFETSGFLFRVFKEKLVFWESVVMFRKACLSLIVVFSYPLGGDSQGILASVLLLLCLYLQLTLRPYKKDFKNLNHLDSMSLLVSAVTFNLSLFFVNDRCSDFVRTLLAAVIISANSLFFLFLLFSFCCSTIAHLRVALEFENIPLPDHAPWWRVLKIYVTTRSSGGCPWTKRYI